MLLNSFKIFALSAGAILIAACSGERAQTQAADAGLKTETQEIKKNAKTKAVLIYADWCSSCKILDPKLKSMRRNNRFEDVQFIVLDYTDRDETAFYADAAGVGVESAIREFLAGNVKTGLLLLIDADDNRVVDKVTKSLTEGEIAAAINAAVDAS